MTPYELAQALSRLKMQRYHLDIARESAANERIRLLIEHAIRGVDKLIADTEQLIKEAK